MGGFEIVEVAAQSAAVVRDELPMDRLPELFDRAFGAVVAVTAEQGVPIVGAPFGFYPRMPGETVEVVAGFPVGGAVAPSGEVVPFELPACRAVTGVHTGPYDRLEQTYEALLAWVAEQGLTLGVGMWEQYLSDPSTDPETWQTLIVWPLA